MNHKATYLNIDMQETGRRLEYMFETAGYSPRMIQEYLGLSCVQPIYRWYKGLILPSVDNLFMLSRLLNVHMEELLVEKQDVLWLYNMEKYNLQLTRQRIILYYRKLYKSAG